MFLIIAALLFSVSCRKTEKQESGTEDVRGGSVQTVPVSFVSNTAYANWTGEPGIYEESLNRPDPEEGYAAVPVYVFTDREELVRFRDMFSGVLSMNYGYDEIPSFEEATSSYGDEFFEERSLILAYVTSGSGTFRYDVKDITVTGPDLLMTVIRTNDPEAYTEDMAGWYIMAEVAKQDIEDCTGFDACVLIGEG